MNKKLIASFILSFGILLNAQYIAKTEYDTKIILDTTTNIVWLDKDIGKKSFKDAISACDEINIGSYESWRVPSYNELISIINYEKSGLKVDDKFTEFKADGYWTSTLSKRHYTDEIKRAWFIRLNTGLDGTSGLSDDYEMYTTCIHDVY